MTEAAGVLGEFLHLKPQQLAFEEEPVINPFTLAGKDRLMIREAEPMLVKVLLELEL
jgi:hypothetical protein